MDISVDTKIGMTLDELAKLKKKGKKPVAAKGKAKVAPEGAARRSIAPKKKGRLAPNVSNAMDIEVQITKKAATNLKVAANVGKAKAKRNASINQKRGLSATSVASKADINLAVKKETAKAVKANKKVIIPKKTGVKSPSVGRASTLKISFNPADLKKTTDKSVALQIQGVLSRAKSKGPALPAPTAQANQSRQVSIATKGRTGK